MGCSVNTAEVESIVTTYDEIYNASMGLEKLTSNQAKEVQKYIVAMKTSYNIVAK